MPFTLDAVGEGAVQAQLLMRAMDTSVDAIVLIDDEGTVLGWTASAITMFGYPAEDALGKKVHELIIPKGFWDAHRAGMARYRETGKTEILGRRLEMTAVGVSGNEFPVELAIAPVKVDGRLFFISRLRDISKRLAYEGKLLRMAGDMSRKPPVPLPNEVVEAQLSREARTEAIQIVLQAMTDAQSVVTAYLTKGVSAEVAMKQLSGFLSGDNSSLLIAKHFFEPLTKKQRGRTK